MSFNLEELYKIKNAIKGIFKGSARRAVQENLEQYIPKIEEAKKLPDIQKTEALKQFLNHFTAQRKQALSSGSNSYGNPKWAAAAVPESWLHELLSGRNDNILEVEKLIDDFSNGFLSEFKKKHPSPPHQPTENKNSGSAVTIVQLAQDVGVPYLRLLKQLNDAGIIKNSPNDTISPEEKKRLLDFLRNPNKSEPKSPKDFFKSEGIPSIEEKDIQLQKIMENPPVCGQTILYQHINKYSPEKNKVNVYFDTDSMVDFFQGKKIPTNNKEAHALVKWVDNRTPGHKIPTLVPKVINFENVAMMMLDEGLGSIECSECEEIFSVNEIQKSRPPLHGGWNNETISCPKGHELIVHEYIHIMPRQGDS